jgi:hypothetical protein
LLKHWSGLNLVRHPKIDAAATRKKSMPVLPNPRHETFAQALAKGKSADEAYALAGFKPNRGNATRLKANDSIQKRVQKLQSRVAEKAEWSAADRLKCVSACKFDPTSGLSVGFIFGAAARFF